MNISIKSIPHNEQRYPTVGDYWETDSGKIGIVVSKMSDERYEFLVALHELIEMALCKKYGVTFESIDTFDKANLDSDDPGSLPDAPYRKYHEMATAIEMIVAQSLGVDWVEYDSEVKNL